ncbi:MAG: thioredoxin domain-containing protein [Gammaproteobacteria bacterium]
MPSNPVTTVHCLRGPDPLRSLRIGLALVLSVACNVAHAVTEPFTQARFEALQGANALILVDVHANWCPTCKKQGAALDAYEAAHPDVTLHRLVVDFDTQKDWVKHFKAPRQSTLILYRGTAQRWFSVAETRPAALAEAIDAAAAP